FLLLSQGFGFGSPDDAFFAYARCSAIDNETTSGRAMELIVLMNWRLDACEGVPDVLTRFLSCSCRIACSASSSLIPRSNDRCMLSVTSASVVKPSHASQAAPAVGFNAKTASFLASTMTVEPSGSLFITKASELVRSICILTSSFLVSASRSLVSRFDFRKLREFAYFATNIFNEKLCLGPLPL